MNNKAKRTNTAQQTPRFAPTIRKYLKEISPAGRTARELAEWFAKKYPKAVKEKINRSKSGKIKIKDKAGVIKTWAQDVGAATSAVKDSKIKTREQDGEKAQEYYYDGKTIKKPTKKGDGVKAVSEEDLYPILREYLESIDISAMRINDKEGKKGSNTALFPDMVGFQDRTDNWTDEIRALAESSPYHQAYLSSYEVKLEISTVNDARTYAFQTLANSSWAHISYLVTEKINDNKRKDIIEELKIIFSTNSTGLIQLNTSDPHESKILIETTPRPDINWNLSNRLAKSHRHFAKFIKSVAHFYKTGIIVLPRS